jgi:hypothetical protein
MIDRILKVIPMIKSLYDMIFLNVEVEEKYFSTAKVKGIATISKNKSNPLRNVHKRAGNGRCTGMCKG